MEFLLASDTPLIREAWIRIWGWYKDTADRPPPPARVAIAAMTADLVDIYWHIPPLGQPIPMGVQPFLVDESIPEDKDISWSMRRLSLNHSGGAVRNTSITPPPVFD